MPNRSDESGPATFVLCVLSTVKTTSLLFYIFIFILLGHIYWVVVQILGKRDKIGFLASTIQVKVMSSEAKIVVPSLKGAIQKQFHNGFFCSVLTILIKKNELDLELDKKNVATDKKTEYDIAIFIGLQNQNTYHLCTQNSL